MASAIAAHVKVPSEKVMVVDGYSGAAPPGHNTQSSEVVDIVLRKKRTEECSNSSSEETRRVDQRRKTESQQVDDAMRVLQCNGRRSDDSEKTPN